MYTNQVLGKINTVHINAKEDLNTMHTVNKHALSAFACIGWHCLHKVSSMNLKAVIEITLTSFLRKRDLVCYGCEEFSHIHSSPCAGFKEDSLSLPSQCLPLRCRHLQSHANQKQTTVPTFPTCWIVLGMQGCPPTQQHNNYLNTQTASLHIIA